MLEMKSKYSTIGRLSEWAFSNKVSNFQCYAVALSTGVFVEYGIMEGGGLIVVLSIAEVLLRKITANKRVNYCLFKLNEICGKDDKQC